MRLTDDQIKMARITYTKVVQDDFILDLIDTIEALQQEIEQYQERLKEIETTSKAIIRDKTEPDKVLIMAEDIEKMCGIVGEKITEALVYRNKKLQQENEQLRAQVAQYREALIIANHRMSDVEALSDTPADYHNPADVAEIELLKIARDNWKKTAGILEDALKKERAVEAIDALIGGKQDV